MRWQRGCFAEIQSYTGIVFGAVKRGRVNPVYKKTTMSTSNTLPSRRRDLDVAREAIVASLILFHTARIFDSLEFHVKNEPREPAVTVIVIFASLWGIPLLFTIAGFAVQRSLRKRTIVEFLRERFQRLVIPLIVGLLIIVPPQMYYQQLFLHPSNQESFIEFYLRFFNVSQDFPWLFATTPASNLFETAHLWFLEVLFVETLLLLPVCLYLRQPAGLRLVDRIANFSTQTSLVLLFPIPIAVIEAGGGTDMAGGWNHVVYVVFLVYGYLYAADARFGLVISEHWKGNLVTAVIGSIIGIVGFGLYGDTAHTNPMQAYDVISVALRFFKGLVGWWWIIAIFGFLEAMRAKRQAQCTSSESSRELVLVDRRSFWDKVERYANQAVLPFYLLHQTIIVIVGYYVVQWHTSAFLKFLMISSIALVSTLMLYELLIKRTQLTRFLFGMKPMD